MIRLPWNMQARDRVYPDHAGGNFPVTRKDDDACRADAERINRSREQWLVLWGCYSRRYWAFPLFEMKPRMIVHAAYPDALTPRMDEAEQRFRIQHDQEQERETDDTGTR
jgi:hypothetical protein